MTEDLTFLFPTFLQQRLTKTGVYRNGNRDGFFNLGAIQDFFLSQPVNVQRLFLLFGQKIPPKTFEPKVYINLFSS